MERPDESANASEGASADQPDPRTVTEALSECIRAALERGDTVDVPGLGTFRVEHEDSRMQEQDDGSFSVAPPRDAIVFEPASS